MLSVEQKVRDIQQARAAGGSACELREELWNDCLELVGSLATRFARHKPQWREDMCNEAYLKFEQALNTFNPDRGVPFRGFLSGCLQRLFIDRLRRRCETLFDSGVELPSGAEPVEDLLCQDELSEIVHDTLADLLPRDRQRDLKLLAFRLRHLEGWSVEAICKHLHIRCANTVSQWIHRVRKAFAVEFAQRYPEYF